MLAVIVVGGLAALFGRPSSNSTSGRRTDTAVVQDATRTPTRVRNTPRPTATEEISRAVTKAPTPTRDSQEFYVISSQRANARQEPVTTAEIVGVFDYGAALDVFARIEGDTVSGSNYWYEIQVNGSPAYIHTSLLSPSRPQQIQVTQPPPQAQQVAPASQVPLPTQTLVQTTIAPPTAIPAATDYPRPSSCATAVAYGLPGEELARRWPHLDRDKDGTACYGD